MGAVVKDGQGRRVEQPQVVGPRVGSVQAASGAAEDLSDRQRLEAFYISPAKLLVLREVWINEDSRTGRSRHLDSKDSFAM